MKNPIGTTRAHKKGYDYFSPNPFPELESLFTEALIMKADEAQVLAGKLSADNLSPAGRRFFHLRVYNEGCHVVIANRRNPGNHDRGIRVFY